MARYDRSIKIAFDKTSGEILDADEVFDVTKDAFKIREMYHNKSLLLSCCECEQDLGVSDSKYDRLYFKHKPGHSYCILSDGKLTPQEYEKFTEVLKSKESDRHKYLKNRIGELLKNVPEVDVDSVSIDNKFIIREDEKRKPDVYCKYKDKEIVFEIQLSDLPLGYILSRYEFYKKHGIYLIWILDNFDIHNQSTLERDIKYLTKYENFFKLDEKSETFKLECEYKFPFLTDENTLLTPWIKKDISLDQLKFDNENFQVFFYNFGENKEKEEKRQKQRADEIEETERKRFEQIKFEKAEKKAKVIVAKIADYRKHKSQAFDFIINDLEEMSCFELEVLNKILKLKGKISAGKPPLIKWIDEADRNDLSFLKFILKSKQIELDINTTDATGRTPLQAVLQNKKIHNAPILYLFQAGYKLTKSDILILSEFNEKQEISVEDFYIYEISNKLTDRDLVSLVPRFSKLLFIIESAYQDKLITFNYAGNKWISFANNAIEYRSEYWEYIELAFKQFGLWDKLIQLDTKGTFQKKVEQFYSKIPTQKYDFDEVFKDLYPELVYTLR